MNNSQNLSKIGNPLLLIMVVGILFIGMIPLSSALTVTGNTKLTASDRAFGDRFGDSAAIFGDTAVIGAYFDDNRSGSAYVFEKVSGTWTQVAKLTASDAAPSDFFGISVSISDGVIIVGSYCNDDNGSCSGSAYVFEKVSGTWTQVAKLTASDAAPSDFFGFSAAISGDVIIVGAEGNDDNGASSGSAYVFEKVSGTWTQVAKLTASDAAFGDRFGDSAAIFGDTAVIGAFFDDNRAGSAYVFEKVSGTWTQVAKLTASDRAFDDQFSLSVSISDGVIIVGSPRNDDNGSFSGSAYVFEKVSGTWTQVAKLTASDAASGDFFGPAVAISDGVIIVGATGDDDNGASSGSAYVFEKVSGTWTQVEKITAPDGVSSDIFGVSAAISGDTAVIGASLDDSRAGSAYVYDIIPTPPPPPPPVDPVLAEILEIIENIQAEVSTIFGLLTNDEFGLEEIKREVRIIEETVGELESRSERVSVTVNLDDIKLETNEVMVLLDTTGSGKLSTVHVTANLPCDKSDTPKIHVVAGVAGGLLSEVLTDADDYTGFNGPEKTCVFHDTVDASDLGHDITDIIIINPGTTSDDDDDDDKGKGKSQKLKGVVVTITGTYN